MNVLNKRMCCFTLSGICWYLIPDPRAPKFYGLFAYGKGTGDGNDLRITSSYHIFVLWGKKEVAKYLWKRISVIMIHK